VQHRCNIRNCTDPIHGDKRTKVWNVNVMPTDAVVVHNGKWPRRWNQSLNETNVPMVKKPLKRQSEEVYGPRRRSCPTAKSERSGKGHLHAPFPVPALGEGQFMFDIVASRANVRGVESALVLASGSVAPLGLGLAGVTKATERRGRVSDLRLSLGAPSHLDTFDPKPTPRLNIRTIRLSPRKPVFISRRLLRRSRSAATAYSDPHPHHH